MFIAVALIIGVFVLAHTAPFPFLLDALSRGRAAWSLPARAGAPTIYLTYDDGPNPAATPALLDVLARERARATFFLIDRWVAEDTAPIVERMFVEGHGVALHSDDRWLMTRSPATIAARLTAAADRIERLTGHRPCRAFRPHAGWRSETMFTGLGRIDYRLVGWGWFAWDWNGFRRRTADAIVQRVMRRAEDGLIVVIHDGHHREPRAERRYAVEATARIVPALRARGFVFGTVCDAVGPVEPLPDAADPAR
jgi:peptidoglycan/xylan/chitin deacetylase (PgdA/CDA1 family)